MQLLLLLISLCFAKRRRKNKRNSDSSGITLKLYNDDKWLGVDKDDKLKLGKFEDAVFLKFEHTNDNIADKYIVASNGKTLEQINNWWFRKSFKMTPKSINSAQYFRIVYYGPNEYVLMKDDYCLGFNEYKKFKRVDCKLGSAAIFNMCNGKFCDSYVDIRKDLNMIKRILIRNSGNGGDGAYLDNYNNDYGDDDNDYGDDDDFDNDYSNDYYGYPSGNRQRNSWGRNNNDDNNDEDFDECLNNCMNIGPSSRRGRRGSRNRRGGGGNQFRIPGVLGGSHLTGMPGMNNDIFGQGYGNSGFSRGYGNNLYNMGLNC